MTTSTARELERRRRIPAPADRLTGALVLKEALKEQLAAATQLQFPSPRFRDDPVRFFREVLGVEPWSKQIEIIEAVRDHPRVAVRSGHKVSKSHSAAGIALWFYSSFDDARVVMTSTTSRQVDQILWRELKMMRARGGRCVTCKAKDPEARRITAPCPHSALVDGDIGELARTGLKSDDFREVVGFTAREAEAVAGVSGRNLLYIVDEASGVDDAIYEAIEGNRAGGARVVLFGNPTRNSGEHYEAFHAKAEYYRCITVSSEETPNVVEDRDAIPGLATRAWVEEKKTEWGEDSSLYKIRVKGLHAKSEDGKIFSVHAIEAAEQRWPETAETGRLFIGLDPAGPTGLGDETVFCPRRGLKQLSLLVHRGLSEQGHLAHLLSLIAVLKLPRETPVVVLDREGNVGAAVYGTFRSYLEEHPKAFELVAVRASDRAVRQPFVYDRARDELTANLEQWFRDGGAIVEDVKLAKELHEPEWHEQVNGRLKVTPKKQLRKALGRSPDRFDALTLSCWEPLSLREDAPPKAPEADDDDRVPPLDPYSGSASWEP